MKINIISESVISPKDWGGVHRAFLNHKLLLESQPSVTITVNSLRKADITHIHSVGPFALYKILTSKHTVMAAHHLPESWIGSYKGAAFFKGSIRNHLRFFYNKADLIIAQTKNTKADLEKLGVTTHVEVLPNPTDIHTFRPDKTAKSSVRERLHIAQDAFVVLSVGYMSQRKGIGEFIAIARKFPDITFVWVGGKSFGVLNAETHEQGELFKDLPKNVLTPGQLPYEMMPEIYNAADVFLFPSHQETQGMVIVEAAACGLPVIIRNLPEYKSLYKNDYLACDTVESFADALAKLHKDKTFYQHMVKKSKELAERYSIESLGGKLISIYRELLSST